MRNEKMGVVLEDVRTNVEEDGQLMPIVNWSAESSESNELVVTINEPRMIWRFGLSENRLTIHCSAEHGVLTAVAPATKERIPARILDTEGKPVEWSLTNEIEVRGWGKRRRYRSFLPQENPDVMYLALGQVSSLNIHCLFDRKTDTVIEFPKNTRMTRNVEDEDALEVTMPIRREAVVEIMPDYYTRVLGLPFYRPIDDSYFDRAPTNWCSWAGFYDDVTEEDIVKMADWISANLKDYGLEYMTLDDGYDRNKTMSQHHWISHWDREKFPRGPKWLAEYVKSKGLKLGIWLVPNAYAGAVEEHPDWYLRTSENDFIYDYGTPSLDYTNPEVLEFMKELFGTLSDWGFEYYKFDGEGALTEYVSDLDRSSLYDPNAGLEAYRKRSEVIRETVGPTRFIEGCPAGMPLDCIDYFDSYFTGCDVYNSWMGMHALFSSISANTFLSHIVCYIMPDGVDVRPQMTWEEAQSLCYSGRMSPRVLGQVFWREQEPAGFGTTMNQAKTIVSFVALSGATYCCTNVFTDLPEERLQLLKMTMPAMPIVPMDLFSRGTDVWDVEAKVAPDGYDEHNYPRIMDLKVNSNSGIYDVVAVINWSKDEKISRSVSFRDQLGLDHESPCVVFDFWNQEIKGVFEGSFTAELAQHETGVYLVHQVLGRPQLVGTSRHITGSQSILDMSWEGAISTLSGRSKAVPGAEYKLWIYVPDGASVSDVKVRGKDGREIEVVSHLLANTLGVSFLGQKEAVDWAISFK